ncbi:hypothetical protein D623_10013179 [Myotis brandtii]|uniref:Uncharacterized protein n=1 Tax=Myotis brandtii TaxID=109478 RepID=S7N522_MYOBR|nr:hypothetical protein D623_10013179 [Myotis brandtii]
MTQPLPALQTGKEMVTDHPAAQVTVVWLWVSLPRPAALLRSTRATTVSSAHSRGTQMTLGSPSPDSGENPEPPRDALTTEGPAPPAGAAKRGQSPATGGVTLKRLKLIL